MSGSFHRILKQLFSFVCNNSYLFWQQTSITCICIYNGTTIKRFHNVTSDHDDNNDDDDNDSHHMYSGQSFLLLIVADNVFLWKTWTFFFSPLAPWKWLAFLMGQFSLMSYSESFTFHLMLMKDLLRTWEKKRIEFRGNNKTFTSEKVSPESANQFLGFLQFF